MNTTVAWGESWDCHFSIQRMHLRIDIMVGKIVASQWRSSWWKICEYIMSHGKREFRFLFFFKIFNECFSFHFFLIVVQVQLSAFHPYNSHPPYPSPPPTLNPTALWLCPCALYTCSWWPFPFLLPLSPSHFSSGYCHFFISMSLVIFCLFVCFVD